MPTKAQVLGIQLKEAFIGRENLLYPQINKIRKLLVILSIAGVYVFHILAMVCAMSGQAPHSSTATQIGFMRRPFPIFLEKPQFGELFKQFIQFHKRKIKRLMVYALPPARPSKDPG